jgi:ATP-dependent Clp protease protease subunit
MMKPTKKTTKTSAPVSMDEMRRMFENLSPENQKNLTSSADVKGAIVPTVREGNSAWDLFSRLLDDRIVLLNGQVDDAMASVATASLVYLSEKDPNSKIEVIINSPGGSVYAGLAIYDVMRRVQAPVHTVAFGMAASMGSLLLCGGDKRSASENAAIMIHQPLGGLGGHTQETDFNISAKNITNIRDRLTQIYVDHTGLDHEVIDFLLERDNWLTSEEAKKLNLIDEVLQPRKPAPYAGIKRARPRQNLAEQFQDVAKIMKVIKPSVHPDRVEPASAMPANDDVSTPKKKAAPRKKSTPRAPK